VAVVINKRRRNVLKDLIKVISQERYEYRDPVTDFLYCLFVDFDFQAAQDKLALCEEVREAGSEGGRQRVFSGLVRSGVLAGYGVSPGCWSLPSGLWTSWHCAGREGGRGGPSGCWCLGWLGVARWPRTSWRCVRK